MDVCSAGSMWVRHAVDRSDVRLSSERSAVRAWKRGGR